MRLWEHIELVLDAFDAAGRPGPETFKLFIDEEGQHVRHPRMPILVCPARECLIDAPNS